MKELTPYQEAALDFTRHISLTANAGSGKTFVLSKRFVQIALSESIPLNSIVAITFTDKAAGELSRKIAVEIEERLASEKNANTIRRLEKLRNQLVFANISTIHSFCINILKEFSPEAEIDADFIPIDSKNSDELIDLCIEEILKEGFRDGDKSDRIKYLIRFFGSKDTFIKQVKYGIDKRKNLLGLYDTVFAGTPEETADFYKNLFENDFNKIFTERFEEAEKALSKINNAVLSENPKNDKAAAVKRILDSPVKSAVPQALIARFGELVSFALTKEGAVAKRGYLKEEREAFGYEIEVVQSLATDLKSFEDDEEGINTFELSLFAGNYAALIVEANDKYEARKRQKGYLDFEDILLKTRDILQLEEIKDYLEKKYRYIMVDEYQDTNEIQYEIIMPILDNLNSGNLCVVGDEKQSIYMFRDADLEVFNRTKEKISELAKAESLLTLPHSFRLAPGIALFINSIFRRVFSYPLAWFNEVEHSDLYCARTEGAKGNVEFLISECGGAVKEAELVAGKIISLYNEGAVINRFSDVLILCRKRNSFKELEEAFTQNKIPYTVVAGKGFFQKQTTLDIYNYLSFLMNKDNDAALAGILRAPFYSVSDAELMAISLCEGESFFDKLIAYSSTDGNARHITEKLQKHLNEVNSYSFSLLIRRILNDTAYWAVTSQRADAAQEIANLEKLISNARKFSLQGYKTLYDYVENLKEAIEHLDDEGQAEISDNGDSVRIMTIHQAKGLEAKAVFLYKASEREKESSIKAKETAIDRRYGIIAKVPPKGDYYSKYAAPPVAGLFNFILRRKNEAETKRLLYVSLTRAVDYLCVSACHKEGKFEKGSLADHLFKAAGYVPGLDELYIKDSLTYLIKKENGFIKEDKEEELVIPVITEMALSQFETKEEEVEKSVEIELLKGHISKREKNEFVSASKISVFAQCPLKYYLTYEIGFSKLFKRMKVFRENYEFNRKEDEQGAGMADLRGTLIHTLLEKNLAPEQIESFVKDMIARNIAVDATGKQTYLKMERFIIEDMKKFCTSPVYTRLMEYKRFKNEFEVYAAEEDYFLYGIVDKIVYDGDKILIIDYKTDSIKKEEIPERAASYFNQLKFYAYAVSKSMKKQYAYELQIIFIKHPEEAAVKTVSPVELEEYGTELKGIIARIRENKFDKNLSHCSQCHLSDEHNNCISK